MEPRKQTNSVCWQSLAQISTHKIKVGPAQSSATWPWLLH